MRKYKLAITLGAMFTFGALNTASAFDEDAGWYVGLSAGQAKYDVEPGEEDILLIFFDVPGSASLDDSDTAWSVFGGYRLTPNLAIEAAYQNLGALEYGASGQLSNFPSPGTIPANVDVDFETDGFAVSALGTLPLGDMFDLHARVGVFFAEVETSFRMSSNGFSSGASDTASSTDLLYGVGAAFHFAQFWTVSLDYVMFKDVGDEDEIGETDIDSFSLGVSYRF